MNFLKQNLQMYCLPCTSSFAAGLSDSETLPCLQLGSSSSSSVEHEDREEDTGEEEAAMALMVDLENGGGSMLFPKCESVAEKCSSLVTGCSSAGKTASM